MPGFIVHFGASVACTHRATAQPTGVDRRVLVSGQPVATIAREYSVTGCPHNISGSPSPCLRGKWTSGSVRVRASGKALVLIDSTSVCTPNGFPLVISSTQKRVTAT
jgi:hypothetical protein